jgi:hypothetical protein
MRNRQWIRLISGIAIILSLTVPVGRAAALNHILDELPKNYQSGGCGGIDLDDVTYPIRNGLANIGWSSTALFYGDAWPQDFIDPTDYADTFDVTVFDGHGNTDSIAFSVPHDGKCCAGACSNLTSSNTLMSAGANARVSSSVFASCCYMNINYQTLLLNHHYEQQMMGFGGVSQIDSGMVSNYFDGTGPSSNVDSWLNNMEDRPSWFTGDNTTVVMSRGHSDSERSWNRWYGGLKRQNCVTGGPGGGYWALDWHDHGCGGCGGC